MDIKEFLGRFDGVKRSGSNGEYLAKCPCHNDKTASLSICQKPGSDGKERIFLYDHAGCSTADILAAKGLTMKDLIVDPEPEGARRGAGGRGRSGSGGRNAAKAQQGSGANAAPADAQRAWASSPAPLPRGGGDGETNAAGGSAPGPRRSEAPAPEKRKAGRADGNGGAAEPDTEAVPGMTVHTAGDQGAFRSPPGTPSGERGQERPAEPEKKIDWDHPDRVYSYTDENGNEVFQVVRYHYLNGVPGKDFRQRMRDPGNPKANRDGWVHSVPKEVRDRTLYRMPKVLSAIRDGRPVYVVEGEKDVETLERLGFTATTNPGGAGKWTDGYTRILAGADLIILPDIDPAGKSGDHAGQDHAWKIALAANDTARRIRIVNLREACPELPDKGDISDMVAIMGDTDAMDALARQVAATRDFSPQSVPFWLTPEEQAGILYEQIGGGYGAQGGCIVQKSGDTTKELTDFVVIPRTELTMDDGIKQTIGFVLDGWNSKGKKLKRVTVSGSELDSMNWLTDAWGFNASVMPGSTTKQKVAWCIKKVGQLTAQPMIEYRHTGWRQIGGKWCYLYQGGAVGMEGVTVNMGDSSLKNYRLDGGGRPEFREMDLKECCRKSLGLKDVMAKGVAIPLLGTMYLAPLREWMAQTDSTPAFSLFLYGKTGTHKSTAVGLAMSHFGNYHAKNAPATFHDTGNQIREKAFLAKDSPFWVDDFHPTTSQQEKRQMNAVAQSLCRAFGDGADRGRLNSDSTIRASRPPRSVAVITGEDLPAVGASGLARFFIVDVDTGDVPFTREFTQMQEDARMGTLQRAMRGYISWLAAQTDTLPAQTHDVFIKNRDFIRAHSSGPVHDRAPEAMACLLTGYAYMLRYFQSVGIISEAEWGKLMVEARGELTRQSEKQAAEMEGEKPTRIFLDSVTELMRSGQAGTRDLTNPEAKDPPPPVKMIGYRDTLYYYLFPEVTFGMVAQLCRAQGEEFPVSLKALYKHLRTDGVLPPIAGSGTSYTRMKRVDGRSTRLLWIPIGEIDGPPATVEQQRMEMAIAVDEDIPEEWR